LKNYGPKISGLAHVPKFYLQESNLIDQLKNQLGHVDEILVSTLTSLKNMKFEQMKKSVI
jgi:hypothetical protein